MGSSGVTSTSTMIAIYPNEEFQRVLLPHADPEMIEDGLHVTLYYVGDTTEEEVQEVIRAVESVAPSLKPLTMYANGPGAFYNGGRYVRIMIMNAIGLDVLRYRVVQACHQHGIMGPQTHGFCPHMTLEYLDEGQSLTPGWEKLIEDEYPRFPCSHIYVVRGNQIEARVKLGR